MKRSLRRRKYRVANKFRFVMCTSLVIGILSLAFVYTFGLMTSQAAVTQEFVDYEVAYGDTLWEIAEAHNPSNKDIREVVYEIKMENGMTSTVILPGQTIKVPIL